MDATSQPTAVFCKEPSTVAAADTTQAFPVPLVPAAVTLQGACTGRYSLFWELMHTDHDSRSTGVGGRSQMSSCHRISVIWFLSGTAAGKRRRLLVLPGMPAIAKSQLASRRGAFLQAASSTEADSQWHSHEVGGSGSLHR